MSAQLALAAVAAAWAAASLWPLLAVPLAAALLTPRPLTRRRPALPDPATLLRQLHPGGALTSTRLDGAEVAVLEDIDGLAAVLELGDTATLASEPLPPLPPLATLLPTTAGDAPEIRLQLLITTTPPTEDAAYRSLTSGRVPSRQRVLLTVRARRSGGYTRATLEQSLLAAVRRATRQLNRAEVPVRPLSAASALKAVEESANHAPDSALHETRSAVQLGTHAHAVFALAAPGQAALLSLPTSRTTLAVTATSRSPAVETAVRLTVPSSAGSALRRAEEALRQAVDGKLHRLDGTHLEGLARTLPFGAAATGPTAALTGLLANDRLLASPATALSGESAESPLAADPLDLVLGGDGVALGLDRHGAPIPIRLFRTLPTRVTLIATLRCARLLVTRAAATGAEVVIQSTDARAWAPLLQPGGPTSITVFDRATNLRTPTSTHPQLVVFDSGPAPAPHPWRTTLLARPHLRPSDVEAMRESDLVLLQSLPEPQATLAAEALGLHESASWLPKVGPDMLAIVITGESIRWANLSWPQHERHVANR
ncbi:hypothetical protein KZZ52_01095 [Dactylosporangium sp. AC04546]|uniref:hypothetical protein n=1 Tax=Dactylosporangium sp. AC04546 TaxID=2862460 RepID=UPI001EE04A33|nr:hypothetical protein [Dactylosporangium sp. AC04546]WVK84072.1 hypothetical protein KZZ52_01095 [Dactylosporangium sp. AC04546]